MVGGYSPGSTLYNKNPSDYLTQTNVPPTPRTEDPAYASLVPLTDIRAKSSGKITVYDYNGNAFAQNVHYIDGATDICTINHVYTDGFCEITYPAGSGTATWLAKTEDFILPEVNPDLPLRPGSQVLPDGDYVITTAANPDKSTFYYVDIYGSASPAASGTNVSLHGPISGSANLEPYDVWHLSYSGGYYTITQKGQNIALDVTDAKTNPGQNIQACVCNGSDAQKWVISYNGRNGYRVQSKCSGLSLDLADGTVAAQNNIQQWSDNDSNAQSWLFIPYNPSYAMAEGKYILLTSLNNAVELDVPGDTGNVEENTQLQLWNDSCPSRYNSFVLKKLDYGYYTLTHAESGKNVEIHGGTSGLDPVSLHTANNSLAQQWAITQNGSGKYMLWNRASGLVMETGNGYTADGSPVRQYPYNASGAQTWRFVQAEYTVSYNANSGTGAPAAQTKYYSNALTLRTEKPQRTGYSFVSWNTKADGSGSGYASGASYTANAAVTLYAQWKPNTYTVSFSANGGSGAPEAQIKKHDVPLTLSTQKPTKDGYSFVSWNTEADGSGTAYPSGGTYSANDNASLYAQWEKTDMEPPVVSELRVSEQDSSGFTVYAVVTDNVKVKSVSTNTYYYTEDWNFSNGYYQLAEASGAGYTVRVPRLENKNYHYTLFSAVDEARNTSSASISVMWDVSIRLDPNGGSVPVETITIPYAYTSLNGTTSYWSTYGTLPTPTRDDYAFDGWYTDKGVLVTADSSVTGISTLYARWTALNCTVSFNANGGSGAPEPVSGTLDTEITLPADVPQRDGFRFLGWAASADASEAEYQSGDAIVLHGDLPLYAVWVDSRSPTITSVALSDISTESCNVSVAATDASAITSVALVPVNNYAQPIGDTLYLSYDGTVWRGALSPVQEKRTTYGIRAVDAAGNTTGLHSYVIGYEVWTVHFDSCGGISDIDEQDYIIAWWGGFLSGGAQYFKTYEELPEPRRSGFCFDGWYTDDGTSVTADSYVKYIDTLYARWTALSCTVSFDANGGSGAPEPVSGLSGTEITLPGDTPQRLGFRFTGWGTAADATEAAYQPEGVIVPEGDATLYAVWEKTDTEPPVISELCISDISETGCTVSAVITDNVTLAKVSMATYEVFSLVDDTCERQGSTFSRQVPAANHPMITLVEAWDEADNEAASANAIVRWNAVVSFDPNGGAVSTASKTVIFARTQLNGAYTYWTSFGELPTPVMDGFDFDGWYTAAEGGSEITALSPVTSSSNCTLYAHWQELEPDFVLPASLTRIEAEAFAGAVFRYVSIPETVTEIGSEAFDACDALRHVLIPGMETAIARDAFPRNAEITFHCYDDSDAYWYATRYGYRIELLPEEAQP